MRLEGRCLAPSCKGVAACNLAGCTCVKAVKGGMCAGAIFRTQAFMQTAERIGTKKGQTIHIEHTVPIAELDREIRKRKFDDETDALSWLLKHSVTTAFHFDQKRYLVGVSSTSEAFRSLSLKLHKPFLRYSKLFEDNEAVWNVFDMKLIEPDRFTFDDHIDIVIRLLIEAKAERSVVGEIEKRALRGAVAL